MRQLNRLPTEEERKSGEYAVQIVKPEMGLVFIWVDEGMAMVSRYNPYPGDAFWTPAYNEKQLRSLAEKEISAQGGALDIPGNYPCSPALSLRARFNYATRN